MTIAEQLRQLEQESQQQQLAAALQLLAGTVQTVKGEQGDKGDKGDQGDTGPQGPRGEPGRDGKDGQAGRDGADGKNGKNGLQGPQGEPGKPGKDGRNGQDGSPDTGGQIVAKINDLPIRSDLQIDARHIKNLPKAISSKKHLGRGTGSPIQLYDLSASLDGVTKAFTLPSNSRVVLIVSSSAPFFFRPTVDYVVSGTNNITLTFDAAIDASFMLAAGQSLGVLYVE